MPAKKRATKKAKPDNLWFKVLVNGKSCHGGDFEWSLPKSGKAGKWHSIPDSQELSLCNVGFHITDRPGEWWQEGASFFIAEYDGEATEYKSDGAKIAVRKVRLLREATSADLASAGVFKDGKYEAKAGEKCLALANSTVTALDNSTVTARDNSTVKSSEYHSGKIVAKEKSTVIRRDLRATISLFGCAVEIDWTKETASMNTAEK